jgi:hypothetical protein
MINISKEADAFASWIERQQELLAQDRQAAF